MNDTELELILNSLLASLTELDKKHRNLTEEDLKDIQNAFRFLEEHIQSNAGNLNQSLIPLLEKVSLQLDTLHQNLSTYATTLGEETDKVVANRNAIKSYTEN